MEGQQNEQGPERKAKEFRSPRGVAPRKPHRLKKGETANPAGSSAKVRLRKAFEQAVTDEASRGIAATLLNVVQDQEHPHYAQAVTILGRIMNLFADDEKREVVVTTDVHLVDRRDGERPRVQIQTSSSSSSTTVARSGDGAGSIEVEV